MSLLLAHLSDAHLGPPPPLRLRDLSGKRLTGFINWSGRKAIHDMDTLARLVADLRARRPDHVMMTGDALNIALPGEFAPAARWLASLGDPRDVSFVPGNHDVYTRSARALVETHFAPWMSGDHGAGGWPYLRTRGDVALIGLNSGIPTAPFLASGRLGETQLDRLASLLDEAGARGFARVVMIHHPPWRGGASPGRGLRDARAFERVIETHGAELIVHGHNHRTQARRIASPGGHAPVIGARSASAVPGSPRHLAGYHLYRLAREGGRWALEARARGLAPGGSEIVDLGPIAV